MKIKSAEAFCKLVELGGVAPAAEAMHCVPSNITKIIKELESILLEPLFNRHSGRLILTPFGRQYYEYAIQLINLNKKIDEKFKKKEGGYTLSIGAIDVAADYWLPTLLVSFMKTHPNIRVTLLRGYSRVLEQGLYDHQFDLIFSDGPLISPEVDSVPAFKEHLFLLGDESRVTTDPIPLYCFGIKCLYRTMAENWLANQPLGRYQLRDMESYPAMMQLIDNQLGVGFAPERIVKSLNVINHAEINTMIPCDVHAVWHRYTRHPAIDSFVSEVILPSNSGPAPALLQRS